MLDDFPSDLLDMVPPKPDVEHVVTRTVVILVHNRFTRQGVKRDQICIALGEIKSARLRAV